MRALRSPGVFFVLICVAAGFLAAGGWIYLKAQLAQILLHRAWARTLRGEERVEPWPWADTWPVARLRVPPHRVDLIVLAGASGRTMAFGPGHLAGSALPGAPGNSVLSGHRDTQFRFLKDLQVGDEVVVETDHGSSISYHVVEAIVVDKHDTSVLAEGSGALLTLITCYPFDAVVPGGPLRYVVRAEGSARAEAIALGPGALPLRPVLEGSPARYPPSPLVVVDQQR